MRSGLLIAAIAAVSLLYAQTPPGFDVASVKTVDPGDGTSYRMQSSASQFTMVGSLQALIRQAYGVEDYRISGGPKWIDSDKFSVEAKPGGQQASLMLRTLLADRFKLALHREMKQEQIYSLVIGKNGSRLERTEEPDSMSSGRGLLRGTLEIAGLARSLSATLGRQVVDNTNLQGRYKFSLTWTPDDQAGTSDNPAPSLFTAIQEQAGLRLESTKGPVEMLMIDRAEKPTEN